MKTMITLKKNILKIIFAFCVFSVISCENEQTIKNEDIILLEVLDLNYNKIDSISGDGTSKIKLIVTLPKNVSDDFKLVTFKSSGGYFYETKESSIQVKINIEGVAHTDLVVPLDKGTLFLTAQIGSDKEIYESKKIINLKDVGKVIDLGFKNIQDQNLTIVPRADGVSIIKLQGNILFNKKEFTSIIFNATEGLFQSNNTKTETKNADMNAEAIVNYIVPQTTGTVFYNVKVNGNEKYIDDKNLVFERAHADEMVIEPTKIVMDTISSNTIKVFLKRQIGKVSIGTEVDFFSYQVVNGTNVEAGRIIGKNEAKTDANGLVTVDFRADTNNFDKTLPIFIRVFTNKDDKTILSKEIELKVE